MAKSPKVEPEQDPNTITSADATALLGAAKFVDNEVRKVHGGAPGTGLYTLLQLVASQLMGIPRSAGFTPAPVKNGAEDDEEATQ